MDTISLTLKKFIPVDFFCNSKFNWKKKKSKKHKLIKSLSFNNCYFQYFPKYRILKLTFSATKLLYGNNLQDFDFKDMNLLYNILMNTTKNVFNSNITDIKEWNITRLDLVTNICFKTNKDKKIFIELIKKLNYSRCKKDLHQSSTHAHNKSITFNFYDKNKQIENSKDKLIYGDNIPNTLRLEIQFKNNSIYRFCKKHSLDKNKTFGYFMGSPSLLNKMYKDALRKIGLDKSFLTTKEMSKLLKKLYKNKEISKRTFNNMYNYFINKSINISKNTLLNYKKILSNYNCSHILLDRKVNKKINFMALLLFKATNIFLSFKKKFKNLHWVLINIILYLIINFKTVIKIYDDS
ncbi:hypothetical protein PMY35_01035 [Clostridium tertium]|uniref:hypothetical protein n=1 Tax=Clostridium tertium TaxID=1559 RepID=UPI00189FDA34|nr:hypothetical protein [Clostridium tertium]MDB1946390.1 hypothetical protein [Clostridium tertium]